jgi:23S rRNA pseudouridine2605 synthase
MNNKKPYQKQDNKNASNKKSEPAPKHFKDDDLNKAQAFFERKLNKHNKGEQQFFDKLDRRKGIKPTGVTRPKLENDAEAKTTSSTYNKKEVTSKNVYAPRNPKAKLALKTNEIKSTLDGNLFRPLSKTDKELPTTAREEKDKMPLNKFLAHAGVSARRDAAEIIKKGEVKVNGVVQKEPGYKVQQQDVVSYLDKVIKIEEKCVYYLLNKPKGFITTTEDDRDRKTVIDLMHTVEERIFPVGRLDRNTTGLLLLTNDGDLSQKLAHPKNGVKKVYQVLLDKPLTQKHSEEILAGLTLDDGVAKVDELAYVNQENKKEIGIEIHMGKNRIVRRIFEHLGYEIVTLDRVMYAGLTKKNLPRGKYRALTDKEIIYLKHY